ncbi:alpha-amylase family glycosyl hydrolase [Coraliomargarita algicola]|uniref:Alpha-amylase family glycosyl hydrolase n=1 Tax=Coraliomargarita algicola TaxID=3092156 RepID=A0ABZ0RTJ5_9BACT|nr:alpha-amylase family glycosyl hydrolase [Coraliomargarita sp. J2-16]WPJ98182.1 alpha-amylase family glycosyl hydrolase [Coraliomargarita sp. J2-16]
MLLPSPRLLLSAVLALVLSSTLANRSSGAGFGMYPDWSKNVGIYEVNVRQFSEAGTLDQVTAYLPQIKAMGIDLVWIMPIHSIGEENRKGSLGSYYAISDYKSVNPEFGTPADFQGLVDRAHELGMYVILDWVANHTAWDHHWTRTNPEFYETNEAGEFVPPVADWTDVIALDYTNAELRLAMIDAMKYWVQEFGVDGFRCDVAEEVPTDFWNQARRELNQVGQVFMLAEGQLPEFHDEAFEMSYAWHQMGEMRKLKAGAIDAKALVDYEVYEQAEKYPDHAIRMRFLTNHDENSWHSTVDADYGAATGVLRAYTFVAPGMPLIYNGEEAGLDQMLLFFEKDVIDWRPHPQRAHLTRLFQWKKRNQALWNGAHGGDFVSFNTGAEAQVWAFYREMNSDKIVALLNLSPEAVSFTIHDSALAGDYTDVLTDERHTLSARENITLNPWGYWLLEAQGLLLE